jgi:hypothetical protein
MKYHKAAGKDLTHAFLDELIELVNESGNDVSWQAIANELQVDNLPNIQLAAASRKLGMPWHPLATRSQYTTLHHHSSEPNIIYARVWRQLIWFHAHKCHDFWSRFAPKCKTFSQQTSNNWLDMATMGHPEPAPLCIITHQTHMDDIQWSGGS